MHRSVLMLLLLISCLTAPWAAAAKPARDSKVIEGWQTSLRQADVAAKAGQWKKAKRSVNSVLTEMCDRITNGEGVAGLFAYATFIRAIAESGLGEEGRASWDFQVAQTLQPRLSEASFEAYGEAGQRLERWRVSDAEDPSEEPADLDAKTEIKIEPPKKMKAPKPKYPFGQRWARIEGPIVVRIVIDEMGIPRSPRLLTQQEPLLGFAALEALRDWRFKPAVREGEPVSVYYNLGVNFRLGE